MFSIALANVTGTRRWLDCAQERGWGLKTGTCKVSNTDNVGIISQADAIMKIKKGIRLRSHQGWCGVESLPESDWLNWHELLVEVEVCVVVVTMLGHMTESHRVTESQSGCQSQGDVHWQAFKFSKMLFQCFNVHQCNFLCQLHLTAVPSAAGQASIGWLWLPPAVWEKYLQTFATREQINQLLFIRSCVISRSCTTQKIQQLTFWLAT